MRRWFNVDAWFRDRAIRQAEARDKVIRAMTAEPNREWHPYDLSKVTGVPASRLFPALADLRREGRIVTDFHIFEGVQRRYYQVRD